MAPSQPSNYWPISQNPGAVQTPEAWWGQDWRRGADFRLCYYDFVCGSDLFDRRVTGRLWVLFHLNCSSTILKFTTPVLLRSPRYSSYFAPNFTKRRFMTSFATLVGSSVSYRSFIGLAFRATFLYPHVESSFTARPIRSKHPRFFTKLVEFDLGHSVLLMWVRPGCATSSLPWIHSWRT